MPELSVVIPVYNEQETVTDVVTSFAALLDAMKIDYEIRVYDDGSRDRTGEMIAAVARTNRRVIATSQPNAGHGPTILRGYKESAGDWIFQIDSDGEMPVEHFARLWSERDRYDFLIGTRAGRKSSVSRRLLSGASRAAVAVLFGAGLRDVNSPFRLMRGSWLRAQLPHIERATVAPNVVLAGYANRARVRLYQIEVDHTQRRFDANVLRALKVWRIAPRAAIQTVRAALRQRFR